MGYIKEPKGINFVVDSTPLTIKEKESISEIIAYYKRTGKKKKMTSPVKQLVEKRLRRKTVLV
jgi:hypothetical protein